MSEDIELIDISRSLPAVEIDLKYATADNITGRAIYRENRCLLHPDAARALARSVEVASMAGLTLILYDAYRPRVAQQYLWDACPDPRYVMDVNLGSHHSRGVAVDVALREGPVLDMGSGFDEMTPRSQPFFPGLPVTAQRHRLLLNAIMAAGGFRGITSEWWHFELPDAAGYPLLTDRFGCYPPGNAE
ncbi:D-alanyl-D-alanine dipeptidase [Sodalis sp. dw_96]|uniref:D-alanyl-D-alanine dipeptidase n=1 Tax=Sodalis sp. dw_96 TaxID=2719794 RepID=UPI001BD2AFA6|nr:D-alanyl-D-alanine dipeptidase [Sodalis sp. dw_96]